MNDLFKYVYSLFLFILTFLMLPITNHAEVVKDDDKGHRILFISSYSFSWLPTTFQIEGLQNSFQENASTLDYEFMDQKNTLYTGVYDEYYQQLKYKLDGRPAYDGVIVGDDAALKFAMTYKEELFPDTPIVFEGINDIEWAAFVSGDPLVTGVVERLDLLTNIELANLLYPEATRLVLIYDELEENINLAGQLKEMSSLLRTFDVEHFNTSTYTEDEVIKNLARYGEESILFNISIGEQRSGVLHTEEAKYQLIAEHSSVPVFSITHAGIGSGMLGGYVIDHKESGYVAGEMMQSILLDGIFPPVLFDTPSTYYFDYHAIKRHRLSMSKLPKGATVINVPETFLRQYANQIVLFLSISLILMLVAYALRRKANVKLKKTYDQLVITESELKLQYEHNQAYTEELIEQEVQIRYQAEYDDLTNLPNRRIAMKKLDELIFENQMFTAMLIDLDDFKDINDTYGHACGDQVIHTLATRLSMNLKDGTFIARFGGDEFLIVANEEVTHEKHALISVIQSVFQEPILCAGIECSIQMSMGIVNTNTELSASSELISNADMALFEAKKIGRNSLVFYDIHMRKRLARVKSIQDLLAEACETDGFKLLFQPQIHAATGQIYGYEALVRFKRVAISPAEFIPIAESTDLILKIGRIITEKAIQQLADWRTRGVELRPIAINFSTKQVLDRGYVPYLKKLLEDYQIEPSLIEIEFTESIFIDNDEQAIRLFEDLKQLGIRMALDDFGTGYSSIRYLTYIPVEKIKLDKSFVDLHLGEGEGALIENIIRLSHSLGLKITIEGVEKKCQYNHLKKLGCDYVQGYYFSKPIEAAKIG